MVSFGEKAKIKKGGKFELRSYVITTVTHGNFWDINDAALSYWKRTLEVDSLKLLFML